MAKKASTGNIKQCATYLIECGCAIMPLTKEGKSPFDIAQMYDNKAFECVKRFCERHHFNNLLPIEVSSRDSAKTFLRDLACSTMIGKVRSRLNRYDNRDCLRNNGLFLLYRIRQSKNQPNEELGLCLHHNRQIFLYPITKNYQSTIRSIKKNSVYLLFNNRHIKR